MKITIRKLTAPLAEAVGAMSGAEALDALLSRGLLDMRAVEALYVRREIVRLVQEERMQRCRAMRRIARELCCSYEKVRGIVYSKTENDT